MTKSASVTALLFSCGRHTNQEPAAPNEQVGHSGRKKSDAHTTHTCQGGSENDKIDNRSASSSGRIGSGDSDGDGVVQLFRDPSRETSSSGVWCYGS